MPMRICIKCFFFQKLILLNYKLLRIVLHAYKNSCIWQMCICHIDIIYKGIDYGCHFFAVPRKGLAILGMPECEQLKLLTMNCQSTDDPPRKWQINEQTKQDKIKTKSNNKDNHYNNNKGNPEADYFVACPDTEADRNTSAKATTKIHSEFSDVFTGIGWLKGTFLLKEDTNHTEGSTMRIICTTRAI